MIGDDAMLKAQQLHQAAQALRLPQMMASAPVKAQVVAGTNADGSPVVVMLISSVNGDFGFPLTPEVASIIGEGLISSSRQAKSGLIV